jgi:hypothetical protein
VIDEIKEQPILFSVQLENPVSGGRLKVDVFCPVVHRHFSDLTGRWGSDLRSRVVSTLDGRTEEDLIGGGSVLEIFWLATDFIRQKLPAGTESDWVNEDGVPAWVLLPKAIPISWGHEFYKRVDDLVNIEIASFTKEIEMRRQRDEMKRQDDNQG